MSKNLKEIDVLAYQFAFKLGIVGYLALTLIATQLEFMVAFFLISVWAIVCLFFLPWLYVWIIGSDINIPSWAIRGPHQ